MLMRTPDLNDLRLLVEVAATGSIGQAAARMGLTQPSASRKIGLLERSMRIKLLQRGTRGSSLTPSGQIIVDWASSLLRAADQFRESVDSLGQECSSRLRAAVSMTVAEYYAPDWLATVRSGAPSSTVSLLMANSSEVVDLVTSSKADVGVIESPRLPSDLECCRIGTDRLALAVRPDHPWASTGKVAPTELPASGVLLRERGSGARDTFEAAMRRAGLEVTPALELASNTALRSAALAGMGPVVLPAVALKNEFESGHLVRIDVCDVSLSRPLTMVWRASADFSHETVKLFLQAARADERTWPRQAEHPRAADQRDAHLAANRANMNLHPFVA